MNYHADLHYHYKPKRGWMNDPNGLVFYKGYYHAFYQHAPHEEDPRREAMHWGHARTKDFLVWEELPVALAPSLPCDIGGCWSGTAVVKDDTLYLFYASIRIVEGYPLPVQTVSVAWSTDGIHFEKYAGNPVIDCAPPDGGVHFRDPAVTCIDGQYYLVIASCHEPTHTARLLLYKSDDLLHWDYRGVLCEWENAIYAECPSLMPSEDGCLMTASVCYTEADRRFSILYGRFSEDGFAVEHIGQVDLGPDQYAGQAFLDPRGRNILLAWIPGWSYLEQFSDKNIGCLSLPRELTLRDGRIYGYPVEEVRHLLCDSDSALERTEDGFIIRREGRDPVVHHGEISDLKLLRDEYIMEVFVNGGEKIYTVLL